MRIVQIAAEFAPIAKAGGLGEVVLGLSRELGAQHHSVDIIIPKYSLIDPKTLQQLKMEIADFRCQEKGQPISNAMWSANAQDCSLHLLEARHPAGYFHRDRIYGFADDAARFLYFSRAAMEYLKLKNEPIDVLHLHDWHAAACAVILKDLLSREIKVKSVVYTIHNLEYQGKCAAHDLDAIGLSGSSYLTSARLQDPDSRYPHTINLMKGGIVYADAVNTVSPTYAKEILTPKRGYGLAPFLKKAKLIGILNGIDAAIWNSATDPMLAGRYSADDSSAKIVKAKNANKELFKKRYSLDGQNRPLIGAVTRLAPQKGTDLLLAAVEQTLDAGGSFVLLASTPVPEIRRQFEQLKELYKNNPRVLLQYEYNEELAHQIYAALDFLLVPSLSEPCGLTQLIALRYGTIPIVRATGGLKDTVFDCEDGKVPLEQRNGFVFYEPTAPALNSVILRALNMYKTDHATHLTILRRAMRCDYSWKQPAQEYLKLYRKMHSAKPKISEHLTAIS
ncbi:MAG: glgA [Parachlamydiales bacterium]|nr:glgA [Parachlamydiales bacterium]